jgi:hypothetical protein
MKGPFSPPPFHGLHLPPPIFIIFEKNAVLQNKNTIVALYK